MKDGNPTQPALRIVFKASIPIIVGAMIAHVPFIFAFLLLSIPGVDKSASLSVVIFVVALGTAVAAGVSAFRWVYRRLGEAGHSGKEAGTPARSLPEGQTNE